LFLNLLIFFLLYFTKSAFKPVFAVQENTAVGAHIQDTGNPSPAILISPDNGAFLANTAPTFVFQLATDPQSPIRHYEMYLNSNLFIKELPSSQTPVETDQYKSIIYQNKMTFTLKQPLKDGVYTWMIKAYDMYGHSADSAVWTFTIDTVPPFIIITEIEENKNLNLSSKDPSSIPANLVLETQSRKPAFTGKTEPGSRIQITLIPAAGSSVILTTTADSNGNFILKPKQNLETKNYRVLVVVSDAASNTTALPEFLLKILQPEPSSIITLPPKIITHPQDLIQLPQVTEEVKITSLLPYLSLIFLLLYLGFTSLGFGFTTSTLINFLTALLLLPSFKKKKICLCFNTALQKKLKFTSITIFQKENKHSLEHKNFNKIKESYSEGKNKDNNLKKIKQFLADKKGRFNLILNQGAFLLKARQKGFFEFEDRINIKKQTKTDIGLCLPLKLNLKEYKKAQIYLKLADFFLVLALAVSLLFLIFNPNIITLAVFFLCLKTTASFF